MEQTVPKVLIRNILQPVVRLLLIAGVLVAGLCSLGIVWAHTITFAVVGLAGLYYIVSRTASRNAFNQIRRELLAFSAPLMLMTTMLMVLSNLDIFFISYFHSTDQIGTYNVIYPLAELLTMTLSGFSFIFLPTFSRLHAKDRRTICSGSIRSSRSGFSCSPCPRCSSSFCFRTSPSGHVQLGVQ